MAPEDVAGAATLGQRGPDEMPQLPPTATKNDQIIAINKLIETAGVRLLNQVFPVGSIYTNKTDSRNPALIFGFGTWTALAGRVIVGKATSGTFATAGATMGAETHTLTKTEMPSHDHGASGGMLHTSGSGYTHLAGGGYWDFATMGGLSISTEGGGGAHNNIQPSLVAYMWERTA